MSAGGALGAMYAAPASTRKIATTPMRLRSMQAAAALGAGAAAAILAVISASVPRLVAVALFGGAVVLITMAVIGQPERVLLGLVLLDIPMQLDVNLFYNHEAAALGAYGGLSVSLTTLALAALYLRRGARVLLGRDNRADPLPARLWLPLAVSVALVALSCLVAEDTGLALRWAALLVENLLLYVYLLRFLRTATEIRFVVVLLIVGLLGESWYILVQWVTHSEASQPAAAYTPGQPQATPARQRATGTFGSPNSAGVYLATFLPVAAAVLLGVRERFLRGLAACAFVVGSLALLLTFSRGGWLGFTIATTVTIMIFVRRGRTRSDLVVAVVSVLAVALVLLHNLVFVRLLGTDDGAAASRVPLMRIAVQIIEQHPFTGVGANNFTVALREFFTPEFAQTWLYTVHNDYLRVLAEVGIVGLLAYLWFLIAAVQLARRAVRSQSALVSAAATGCYAALLARFVEMNVDLFSGRLEVQSLTVLASLAAALCRMTYSGVAWPAASRAAGSGRPVQHVPFHRRSAATCQAAHSYR